MAQPSITGHVEGGAAVTCKLEAEELVLQKQRGSTRIPLHNLLHIGFNDALGEEYHDEPSGGSVPTLKLAYVTGKPGKMKVERQKINVDKAVVEGVEDTSGLLEAGLNGHADGAASPPGGIQKFCDEALRRAYKGPPVRRRALVFVNPHAGNGKALSLWEERVKPIFEGAGMVCNLHKTAERYEARWVVESLALETIDCIVVCSGDGLVHEVFNGLAFHKNGNALSKMPVAHIPCGSGNACSRNLYGAPTTPDQAALAIVKGVEVPMDLMEFTQENDEGGIERTFSFLSQAIGMVAECDLDTENLRWILPNARFLVGFIIRAFQRKTYRFEVSFKTEVVGEKDLRAHWQQFHGDRHASAEPSQSEPVENGPSGQPLSPPTAKYGNVTSPLPEDWVTHRFEDLATLYCGNMAYMTTSDHVFPTACMNDGTMDLVYMKGMMPLRTLYAMTNIAAGKTSLESPTVPYQKVSGLRVTPLDPKGSISLDGERMPWKPFQAEIHRGAARVIASGSGYQTEGPVPA